jgi:hypothetical protein
MQSSTQRLITHKYPVDFSPSMGPRAISRRTIVSLTFCKCACANMTPIPEKGDLRLKSVNNHIAGPVVTSDM